MPGRYFIIPATGNDHGLYPEELDHARLAAAYETPRYNVSPQQQAPVLRSIEGEPVVSDMRWGFAPRWMKDPSKAQINARSETMFEKRMFQQAARTQRCLVPVSGWYEWQPVEGGKQAWAIHRRGFAPFAFAGLWTVGNGKDGGPEENFLTLTVDPSEQLRPIHHRMPVILDAAACRAWLDAGTSPETLQALMVPWRETLELRAVSSYVNSVRHQGPQCLEEANGKPH